MMMAAAAGAQDNFVVSDVRCIASGDSISLYISGSGTPVYSSYTLRDPARIVINLDGAVLPSEPIEKTFVAPVKRLEFQYDYIGSSVLRLVCELGRIPEFRTETVANGIKVVFAAKDAAAPRTESVNRSPEWLDRIIDVNFENTSIDLALSLLAKQNGFDIVVSGLDDHAVTARLAEVRVGDALDAILLGASGLSYFTVGNIVVVNSSDDQSPGEMSTRIFKLKFLDSRQVEQQVKNMLSVNGKVQVVSAGQVLGEGSSAEYPANVIAVTDVNPVLEMVDEFIARVDTRPNQVTISVKLIETNINDDEAFGFDWRTNLTAKISDAENGSQTGDQAITGHSAYSPLPLKANSFVYGTLSFSEVSTLLEYLKARGESRLLSSPSVTTTDGKPAVIDVVSTIPIQTINRLSEGAIVQDIVTYQFKDVGITLDVTPIINSDGYVTLKCEPSVEEITGWVGPSDNQQPITSKRSVQTDVMVKSGETLVIGGLMKESSIEKEQGIWLLSDIPVLGELFKHRSIQRTKTDLMILITPTVIP